MEERSLNERGVNLTGEGLWFRPGMVGLGSGCV